MTNNDSRVRKPTMNPYLAGVLLGMTLLLSYLTLGAGLGASGGLARVSAYLLGAVAPMHTLASEYFSSWGSTPLAYYLAFMMLGTFLGGLLSALQGNRIELLVERGRSAPMALRIGLDLAGGIIVGFASRLAQGCTSGQALSGGAMLLTGSLLFLICLFASGFVAAALVRRQWDD
jgi:uncharacterized protein